MLAHMKRKVIGAEKSAPEITRQSNVFVRSMLSGVRPGMRRGQSLEAASIAIGTDAGAVAHPDTRLGRTGEDETFR
jgi:hypothetical protein